jgi:excisionase family DNA binding protein
MKPLLVNKRAAAEALSISVRGVGRLIAEGELPSVRVRGSVRIPVSALRAIAAGKGSSVRECEKETESSAVAVS